MDDGRWTKKCQRIAEVFVLCPHLLSLVEYGRRTQWMTGALVLRHSSFVIRPSSFVCLSAAKTSLTLYVPCGIF